MQTIDEKKDIRIQLRISKELKDSFDIYCKNVGSNMSDELKRYIVSCIKKENK